MPDTKHDDGWVARPEWLSSEGIRSFGGQPLIYRGEILGVLAVLARSPMSQANLVWMRMISDHAATAIANARALAEIHSLQEQLALDNDYLREEILVTHGFGGIIGFVPNPIVSAQGIFVVNLMHNVVHILTGVAFLAGGLLGNNGGRATILAIGVCYVAVAVVGFLTFGDMLLGMVHINQADRWPHVFLAAGILATGAGLPEMQGERA